MLVLSSVVVLVAAVNNDHPPLVTGAFTETTYTATLSGEQVVPQSMTLGGFGTAFCQLNREKNFLACHISHIFPDALAVRAWIGHASRASNGPSVYEFTVALDDFIEQNFILEDLEGYPVYNQVQDFLNGEWFLAVESTDSEEIRGQLEQSDNIYALLASENTFPEAWGSPKRGIALGTYSWFDPKREAAFDICHDVDDAFEAEIGHGVPGLPGSQVYEFRSALPPIIEELTYTIQEEIELLAGYQYVQVYNAANRQGAVRGQLKMVDPIPEVALTGRLDSQQAGNGEASFARGCALISYDCSTRTLEYLVVHDVASPISAQIRAAPPGSRGAILFSLSTAESPIYGSKVLSAAEEYLLYAQQMYVQVDSLNFPQNGEIRGQLTTQFDFFAYLTGNQMVPPVTTASLGCASFDLTDYNYNLDFEVVHSVDDPTNVYFVQGKLGETGTLADTRQLQIYASNRSPDSPVIGDMTIDDDEQVNFVQGFSYVQVNSAQYPLGEIRGQIYRIHPCDPDQSSETSNLIDYAPYTYVDLPITFNEGNMLTASYMMTLAAVAALLAFF